MDGNEILQKLREQRHATLSLADQIPEERWREPAMPGGNTIHDVLAHLLGWDEWTIGVFELSHLRDEVPPSIAHALDEVDAFNARSQARFRNLTRDDMLSSLQTTSDRIVRSAFAVGGEEWDHRRLNGISVTVGATADHPGRAVTPSVRGILRTMLEHEREHDAEIATTFGISPRRPGDETGETGGETSGPA
jgi:uncharacterized damage-inducible protein DinB